MRKHRATKTSENESPLVPPSQVARKGRDSVRFSAISVIGRQVPQIICALILARVLGPSTYGIISAATVYVTLTTLLLDQGMASALIQRPTLSGKTSGAVATANLVLGLLLAGMTWLFAGDVADFFRVPGLTSLLRLLGVALLIKAVSITPRAMRQRRLSFKAIALADSLGGVLGAATGIAAALFGAGFWALAWQVVVTDLLIAGVLIGAEHTSRPNLQFRELSAILPFSLRIFGSNGLAYASRNVDNVLVGRVLGVESLSYYSMAYRVLVIPVQMIGQTVNRVTFPMFARLAADTQALARSVRQVTEMLALATIPVMGFVAVSAHELVALLLGSKWLPTVPVLTVLAIAGARETVFSVTGSLMKALGRGKLILRYEIVATGAQVAGIVVGLHFGLLGVAVGYASVGFFLIPVLLSIQRRLSGATIRAQLAAILPSVNGAIWGSGAYLLVRLTNWSDLAVLLVGSAAFATVATTVLALVHRNYFKRSSSTALSILGLKRSKVSSEQT